MKARTIIASAILAASSFAQAGNDLAARLQAAPASQWDIGVLRLRLAAYIIGQHYQGTRIGDTSFKLAGLTVRPQPSRVFVTVQAVGPARKLSRDSCRTVIDRMRRKLDASKAARIAWPDQAGAHALIHYAAEIKARENAALAVTCEN